MTRRLISSGSTFEQEIGYSRAVVAGDWIFVSGTTGFDYSNMSIAEDLSAQTEQCLKNIASALQEAGAGLADVVRVTYVLPNAAEFSQCWPVLRKYFGEVRPAAMMISAGLADPRMRIEIEVTALKQSGAEPHPPRRMTPISVRPLLAEDRPAWEVLARGYKAFYATPTTDAEYLAAWSRILAQDDVHAFGAFLQGELVGIAHYLFHTSVWARTSCYLQDLFTSPEARGRGVARALIDAVAVQARARGAARYYWHTQEHNAVARALYDKVGKHVGFIRYDYPLATAGR